ncbi:hypothetical protein ON010_g12599 [Phytophthora cinnamomi]|nr:hypothetical protein ON010_g12599 [Phytophthora cinnamomi]
MPIPSWTLEGLRVVDASIMPNNVSGILMLAEKAADIILGNPALPQSDVLVYEATNWEASQRISTTQLSSGLASIGQRQYHPLLSKLQQPDLVRAQGFINGEWVEALMHEHFIVEDPATELEVARVTSMGAEDTHTAVTAAMSAQREWKRSTPPGRAKLLREWAAAITANSQDLAIIGSVECGKPLAEAKWEVELAVGVIEYFAHEIVRSSGFLIYPSDPRQKILVSKEPVGSRASARCWVRCCGQTCRRDAAVDACLGHAR